MKFLQVVDSEKERYNQFVSNQSTGSFLQAYEWGEWQKNLGKQVSRFFVYGDDDHAILSLQVLASPLGLGRVYVYAPYGPVVKDNYELTVSDAEFLVCEMKKAFPEAVFFRFEPKFLFPNQVFFGRPTAHIQPAKTLLVDLLKTEEELLSQMHPKTRYNIKVAQRHGVQVQQEFAVTAGHGLYTKEVLEMIFTTARRQGFVTHAKGYYRGLLNFFSLYHGFSDLKLHIYKALYQQELLAAAVMVDFGATRFFLFGGSSQIHKNVMAPYFLHFQAMLDAKAANLKYYDFWGVETASGATPGFVRFKLGFGGNVLEYEGAKDLVIQPLWYNVYTMFRFLNRLVRKIKKVV